MKLNKEHMLLYAVTDRGWLKEKTLAEQVEEALKGGVTCLQLREKYLSDEDFLSEAMEIGSICKKYNVPFIINDNVEVAIKCKADGIHIGQEDMEAKAVREKIGKDMSLGVSVHSKEEALDAVNKGANYLGVGAVFATATKEDANTVDHETLKEICESVNVPVVAIGGIYDYNIHKLSKTGVDGVAVVSGIFAKKDITLAAKELLGLSKEMVKGE